jgi:hypothetical protein
MTKKVLTVFVLFVALGAFSWGQAGDLVVILDTSSSMSSSYTEVADYLTGPFLREQLRLGDTFHLISFSLSPALELSRRIEGRGDIQTIVGRLLILYPVNPDTDLISALEYGRRYVAGLPQGRTKKVFLVSDGDHGVSGGPYAGMGPADARERINGAQETYKALGADFRYIPVPLSLTAGTQGPSSGTPGPSGTQPSTGTQGPSAGIQGPSTGTQGPSTGAQGPSTGTQGLSTGTQGPSGGTQGQTPPQTSPDGPGLAAPETTEGLSGAPRTPETPQNLSGEDRAAQILPAAVERSGFSLPLPVIMGIIAGAIVILALILILMGSRLRRSPNRAMAQAASGSYSGSYREEDIQRTKENAALLASYAASQRKGGSPPSNRPLADMAPANGPMMLSLFVADQNTAIGKRNIHTVKPGYTFSVGGGRSDFLIFLVPMPSHIADLRYDGANCTFIPRKSQYFPDLGSSQLPNCIGQNIRVISDKNYELHIRVERYQDPLITLNRMLHSIELPGLPDF